MSKSRGPRAQEILDTAIRLFARQGYDGVSVRDICAELRLNISVISYYFGGKKELYLEVLRNQLAAYGRALADVAALGLPFREHLAALCEAIPVFQAANPNFSAIVARESGCPSPEFLQVLHDFESEYGNALVELIREGQRQGACKSGLRAEHLGLVLNLLFNGASMAGVSSSGGSPERAVGDYFEAVKTIIFDGLLTDTDLEDGVHRLGKKSAKSRGFWGR